LQAGRAPFDADLLLFTHHHGDHFHPAPVVAHLRANPRARLVASAQVLDSLRHLVSPNDALWGRLLPRTTPIGRRTVEVVNGVRIELLGLRHHTLEHLGFIVELGGRRILHVGDNDGTPADFEPLRLTDAQIDVALLPDWMLTSEQGRRAIQQFIRPKQVIAFHVMVGQNERVSRAVRLHLRGAHVFYRSLETRSY
jgi:L-ascorbate metabolism protein UlaG (beta-lactamase superfamily)